MSSPPSRSLALPQVRRSLFRKYGWLAIGLSILLVRLSIGWLMGGLGSSDPRQLVAGEYRVVDNELSKNLIRLRPVDQLSGAPFSVRLWGLASPMLGDANAPSSDELFAKQQGLLDQYCGTSNIIHVELARHRTDPSGLGLVILNANGKSLNEELVAQGLAVVDQELDDPSPLIRRLKQAQQNARESALGIWAEATNEVITH
jgi:Staphylococcal nuclease homologue